MNEKSQSKFSTTRSALAATAIAAAVAGGYALHGTQVTAQENKPSTAMANKDAKKTPMVETPATKDAVSMQRAFNEVSKAIEPAVVTITSQGAPVARSSSRTRPMPGQPFPGFPDSGQGDGDSNDQMEEFLRRFKDFGFSPNSTQKEQVRQYFRQVQEGQGGGLGSGMIYRADGYIITNAHVVQGAKTVGVKLNDGREFKNAKVVGSDERSDIAVVKVPATNLPVVRLGDSSEVNVGDWAIAVGNPFGLEHTLTVGVISAKAREVPLEQMSQSDFLQTDASINPGNSGGPLSDIYGRVIGVNNAIISRSGGNVGIGFAIPVNTAKNIADRIVKDGRVIRGYLGVNIQGLESDAQAQGLGLDPKTRGVLISDISDPNAPGAKAGLQVGDVVIEFNGKPVKRDAELVRMVGDAPVGSNATLKVLRNGQIISLNAKLAELPAEKAAGQTAPETAPEPAAPTALGLTVTPITPELSQQLKLKDAKGVVVMAVKNGSPADQAGLLRGDVIERVAQTPVNTPQELKAAVDRVTNLQKGDDKQVALYINRGGQKRFAFIVVE